MIKRERMNDLLINLILFNKIDGFFSFFIIFRLFFFFLIRINIRRLRKMAVFLNCFCCYGISFCVFFVFLMEFIVVG